MRTFCFSGELPIEVSNYIEWIIVGYSGVLRVKNAKLYHW